LKNLIDFYASSDRLKDMNIQEIKRCWTNKEVIRILKRFRDRNDAQWNCALDKVSAIFISFDRDLDWLDHAEKKSQKTR